MVDAMAWHREALAGRNPPIHDGKPECGFFRKKFKDGTTVAAAIWQQDGRLICRVGNDDSFDPVKEWAWLSKSPITEDDAFYWFEHGAWPGTAEPTVTLAVGADTVAAGQPASAPPPAVGDNSRKAPEAEDALLEQVESALTDGTQWVTAVKVTDQATFDQVGNRVGRLRELNGDLKKTHKRLKEPVLAREREIYTTYLRRVERVEMLIRRLLDASNDYLREEQRKRDAEVAKLRAQADADEKARQERLQEQVKAMEQAAQAGKPPPPVAQELPIAAAPKIDPRVKGGGATGKRISLRTETVVTVTDHAKALKYFAKHPDVVALVQKLASAAVKAGGTVPGTETREEARAQ